MSEIDKWTKQILTGNSRVILHKLPDDSIDLVVTSPPYNVGIDYGDYQDNLSTEVYGSLMRDIFYALNEKVKDSGRVCINVALKNDNGIIDTPSIIKEKASEFDWTLRFETIWDKGSSESSSAWGSWRSPSSPRPIFNHEYILIFDVGDGKKESEKTLNKKDFMKYVKSVWDISPETGSDHPAPFPKEIPRRLISMNSYEGDVVLDPFLGSGTTAVVAEELNRDWIGIEMNEEFVEKSYERITEETTWMFDERSVFDY